MTPELPDNVVPLFGGSNFTPEKRDEREELTSLSVQAVGPKHAGQLLTLCEGITYGSKKNIIASARALTESGHAFEEITAILTHQVNRYKAHS